MKVSKETEQKIMQLQLLEQNINHLSMQRQTFQNNLMEIDNAMKELKDTKEDVYKIVSNVMIKSKKETLIKELEQKKDVVELRIKNLEKQEKKLKEKAEEMQQEVMKELK